MESTMQTITGGLLMFQITQEEIGEIIDITEEMCNLEGWTEEALPLAQKRMAIIEKARSRPAPSPDPRVAFFEEDNAYKDSIIEQQRIHINTLNVKMSEMMQGAAAQARDKALDDAISAIESVNISDVEDARDAIESLRTGGEPR